MLRYVLCASVLFACGDNAQRPTAPQPPGMDHGEPVYWLSERCVETHCGSLCYRVAYQVTYQDYVDGPECIYTPACVLEK